MRKLIVIFTGALGTFIYPLVTSRVRTGENEIHSVDLQGHQVMNRNSVGLKLQNLAFQVISLPSAKVCFSFQDEVKLVQFYRTEGTPCYSRHSSLDPENPLENVSS